jgi:uncharacterized membrane protein YphA (DoxX/SURF4 family)
MQMNGFTKFFLVLLRLAIGWHLLFEGVVKVRTHEVGKTVTNTPFTSAPYLRDANGPFRKDILDVVGDPDDEAKAKLTRLSKTREDPLPPYPEALELDWESYLQRWSAYYQVDAEQERAAAQVLAKAKDKAMAWISGREGEKEITKEFGGTVAKRKRTPPDRIQEYEQKLRQLREMQDQAIPQFQRDVFKKELTDKKAEVARLRTELMADLDALLKEPLQALLTPEQRAKPPMPDPSIAQPRDLLPNSWPNELNIARGMLPPAEGSPTIHWIDWLVRIGLVCIGVAMLLGFFTRFSCFMGALIILLITLPYLPLPGLPDNPRSLPFYYMNQNIIEIIALLALATTRSGRWLGIDGLLYVLRPSRYRKKVDTTPSVNGAAGQRRMVEATR